MKRRLLSALLAMAMLLTMAPTVAFAADEDLGTATDVTDGTDQGSSGNSGSGVVVEMDNLLLRTNQAAKIRFTVTPEELADQITFEATEECQDVLDVYQNSSGIWYARYGCQGIEAGTIGTINALYNGQVVGTCQVLFWNLGDNIYTLDDGTELTSIPFATPTIVHVSLPKGSLTEANATISGWEWNAEGDADAFEVVADTDDSSQATVTFYQKKSGSYSISAVPTVTIGNGSYVYNYATTRRVSVEGNPISYTAEAIYQGGFTTLTFNLPESILTEDVTVKWSSENEDVLRLDKQNGKQAVFAAPNPSPISGQYLTVTVTASATINGRTYSGEKDIWVYKASVLCRRNG